MAFSGGTYTLPAGNPVTAGNTIEASWANTTLNDIATALSTCVLKDGTQTLTANIPMGGFKLTGLAAGSAANDSVRMAQLQGGSVSYLTGTAGTNTVTALGTPTVTALTTGQRFTFIPANTNTAATTLQVDSTSALSVFWNNAALVGGELRQNVPVTVLYDGTQYQLIASGAMANTFATPDTWRLQANGDRTKQVVFRLTGISTATTRVITVPDADISLANWSTGDVKLTLKTTADTGWVLMNDGTIGSAASAATTRANADTETLYTLLRTNTANADCAVSGGRGASAAADFAANKTIALPKTLGRALATYGTGSGLTARALAAIVGAETLPAHTHTQPAGAGANSGAAGVGSYLLNGSGDTGSTGTGTHGVMQPTVFLNVMIKL